MFVLQIQGSRESVHIDLEGASTSGQGDTVHALTDIAASGEELELHDVTASAPPLLGEAQVEYHAHEPFLTPSAPPPLGEDSSPETGDLERKPLRPSAGSTADSDSSVGARNKVGPSDSFDSVHSTDSDANELQSLMPKHDKESKTHCPSDHEDELREAT